MQNEISEWVLDLNVLQLENGACDASCALTSDDVEHSGVENGRTDEPQEDETTGGQRQTHFGTLKDVPL